MPRSLLDLSDLLLDEVPQRRPSLGAIVAGAVVALAVQFILTLFATYAGLDRFDGEAIELATADTVTGIAMPALMLGIAGLCGGWVAGRLTYLPGGLAGPVHGVVAWALAMLVAAVAATGSLDPLSSGAFSVVGRAYQGAPADLPTVAEAIPDIAPAALEGTDNPQQTGLEEAIRRAREFLSSAPESDREQIRAVLLSTLERLLRTEQPIEGPDAQRAIDLIQQFENGDREQAESRLLEWVETYRQAVSEARRRAEAEAARRTMAALIAATSLAAGGLAAFIGGWLGAPSPRRPAET